MKTKRFPRPLQSLLRKVDQAADGETANLKNIIEAFGDRAFGPVLALCGVILLTPLGAVPGVPVAVFVVLSSFAIQILLGRKHPWIPKVLAKIEFKVDQLERAKQFLRPWLAKIDGLLRPRWPWALRPPALRYSAFLTLLLAASLLPLGPIPFAATIPGALIIILGLGTTARDGVFIFTGHCVGTLCFAVILAALIT